MRVRPLRVERIVMHILLILVSITMLFPFYFVMTASLKDKLEYVDNRLGLPRKPILENFRYLLIEANILDYFMNTILLISITLVLYIVICSFSGFAFGKLRFRWKGVTFLFVLFLLIFPQMVLSMPLFSMMAKMGLINKHAGVILVWLAYFTPFGTYIMSSYYSAMPNDLVEAARIDGANIFRILFGIFIPLAGPMIATISIIGFQAMWSELPFSLLLLQRRELRTLTLGIAMLQGEHGLPIPVLSAAVVISAIIPLILFLFFQKNIVVGVVSGSVKG
ncbi:MAG TPA: carbohydrate ABC transporter permease [Spirochaetia bacterium]|nr:carbohydrate ABC transporter permease [Spirochaetia bacterium]